MKGDFSRNTFNAKYHFSRVLMQQGRVQLDADWNEQASILLHYLQTLAADLIGPYGGPTNGAGFAVSVAADRKDLLIGRGHYYVDGLLCENDTDCKFSAQPDYPLTDDEKKALNFSGNGLIYLDVWERHITYLEDDHIREVALGGPDTATRAKVVWQVKALSDDAAKTQLNAQINRLKQLLGRLEQDLKEADPQTLPEIQARYDAVKQRLEALSAQGNTPASCDVVANWSAVSDGRLRARVKPENVNPDPCILSPDAKYRGAENQLYRVEIHDVTHDTNGLLTQFTFKWSRDNGSVVTRIVENRGPDLVVRNSRGFAANQWVELTDDQQELRGQHGPLVKITKVEGDTLTIDLSETSVSSSVTTVRRWDQTANANNQLSGGAVVGKPNTWLDLEDGVQVQFESDVDYRTGDYWLIPARTIGTIEWPNTVDDQGNPVYIALPPHGVYHHYAPLATLQNGSPISCRCLFDLNLNCNEGKG